MTTDEHDASAKAAVALICDTYPTLSFETATTFLHVCADDGVSVDNVKDLSHIFGVGGSGSG